MKELSFNTFRTTLKSSLEDIINTNEPLKVNCSSGKGFVVLSFEDWQREQETLYVLQNSSLIKQITESIKNHSVLS